MGGFEGVECCGIWSDGFGVEIADGAVCGEGTGVGVLE